MIALRLRIHGRVQGVFFRDSVRREAERHGVSGWARNCDDGSVEVYLEGAPGAVEAVSAYCRQGPPQARVERVEAEELAPRGEGGFAIR